MSVLLCCTKRGQAIVARLLLVASRLTARMLCSAEDQGPAPPPPEAAEVNGSDAMEAIKMVEREEREAIEMDKREAIKMDHREAIKMAKKTPVAHPEAIEVAESEESAEDEEVMETIKLTRRE